MFRALAPSGVPIRLTDILSGILAMFSGRKAVTQFEAKICQKFGVRHAFTLSSGRAGLSLLCQALQRLYPDRNEVLIPAFTSFSVPSAVVNAGLKLSLYDIDPATFSPVGASLRSAITDRTLCIIVCHLFGYPVDMDAVLRVTQERNIPIIDDAAQAMGATYKGKLVGTFGTAGLFSLSRGKNITAIDGGIIVTNDELLAKNLTSVTLDKVGVIESLVLMLKAVALSFLLHPRCYWLPRSFPPLNIGSSVFDPHFILQEFTAFQAGIAQRMLERLESINADRRSIVERLTNMLSENKKVTLTHTVAGGKSVFLRFPVMSSQIEGKPELGIVRSYPTPVHHIQDVKQFLITNIEFPGAQSLSERLLTLPTHCYMTKVDCMQAVKAVV